MSAGATQTSDQPRGRPGAGERASASAFSPGVVLVMVLVAVLSFCGFFVLSAYAPELRTGTDGGSHALSRSAVGFAGVVELLRARGAPVVIRRGRESDAGEGLLVITPEIAMSEAVDELLALGDLLSTEGAKLVVLPKWNAVPDFRTPGWVVDAGFVDAADAAAALPDSRIKLTVTRQDGAQRVLIAASDARFPLWEPAESGPIRGFQTIASPVLEPVLEDAEKRIVLGRIERTSIYILSEPDLLDTQGLSDPDTAWLGVQLLETLAEGRPVAFDVTLHGFERTRNLLKLAFEPPFLSATLCALAAAALMGLHAAARFGPSRRSRRAFALGKTALVENSAALVRMTRRETRMARGYAALTLASAAQAAGVRRGADEAALRRLMDRLSQVAGLPRTYSELAESAEAASTPSSLFDAARALHAWRTEMTRERR